MMPIIEPNLPRDWENKDSLIFLAKLYLEKRSRPILVRYLTAGGGNIFDSLLGIFADDEELFYSIWDELIQ